VQDCCPKDNRGSSGGQSCSSRVRTRSRCGSAREDGSGSRSCAAAAGGAKPKFDKAAMLEKIRQKKAEKGQ